ncbi:hypothetical protein LUZ63_000311 [Rhynchospora breviuscula]|uniref:ENTH domain-containing protein n=1 Tax=Rhynchospora breviuscula TaxID=2022672 RepID=A0A9Q0CUS7_9POAL|nr:hypothetical protein LUZ63_000311 [Rhynchospora breviuscula]
MLSAALTISSLLSSRNLTSFLPSSNIHPIYTSMGLKKLHNLVGAIKDTTSITKAALTSPSSAAASAHLAVLRATSHLPTTSPPSPHHLSALLSFGRSSRLTASSLVSALSSRLFSTQDPSVALKSLLCLHLLLSRGSFILKDQIFPALLRHPASGRNPLALSSFRSAISYSLSAWVRWFARVLELMLVTPSSDDPDQLTVLQNQDVISELESLVAVVEEISHVPEGPASTVGNQLKLEVARQAEEDWVQVSAGITVRVREMKERVGLLSYSDSVELLCVLKRIEEVAASQPSDWEWMAFDEGLLSEVGKLKGKVEEEVVRKEEQERRVRREKVSESARLLNPVRSELVRTVRFGSTRWVAT